MTPPNQPWAPLPSPPLQQAAPYYGGFPPPAPAQKPSSFYRVVGIVQIALGACGILYSLFSIATTALASSFAGSAMMIYDTPTLVLIYLRLGVSVMTGAALGVTGIGVLRAKRWARYVGVGYAVTSLLNTISGTAVQLLYVQPRMSARMHAFGVLHGFEAIVVVSAIFSAAIMSAVPVLTLVALLRAGAKEELDG